MSRGAGFAAASACLSTKGPHTYRTDSPASPTVSTTSETPRNRARPGLRYQLRSETCPLPCFSRLLIAPQPSNSHGPQRRHLRRLLRGSVQSSASLGRSLTPPSTTGSRAADLLAKTLPSTHRVVLIDRQRCVLLSLGLGTADLALCGTATSTVSLQRTFRSNHGVPALLRRAVTLGISRPAYKGTRTGILNGSSRRLQWSSHHRGSGELPS